ncbi:hypothetical protein V8E52_005254 [Russula decolorans]
MPASTPSTTLHGRDIMAPIVVTPVPTWAQTIFTEVGKEILEHAQRIADDWASSTYAGLRHLARDFHVTLDGRNVPRLKYIAGRFVLLAARAVALRLAVGLLERAWLALTENLRVSLSFNFYWLKSLFFPNDLTEAPLSTYLPPRHPDPSEPCDLLWALARLNSARPPTETPPEKTLSPANSQDSHLLDTNALNATASAPKHPSMPISVAASLSTLPRTSSPSGSVAPATASELSRSTDKIPLLHLKRRMGTQWEYSSNLTGVYFDVLREIATSGTTFKDKNALITGVEKGSIGVEILKGLMSGVEYYQGIFQCFGSRGSALTVVPFNQGSKQNVETLVDYNYTTLGLDLDYVIPFAAVSENGREIDGLNDNAIKTKKASRQIVTRPTQVVLPLSPNDGLFGTTVFILNLKSPLKRKPLRSDDHDDLDLSQT